MLEFPPELKSFKDYLNQNKVTLPKELKSQGVHVISGFPGTGKSYATKYLKEYGYNVQDSDSSMFDKKEFPQNYIGHIKEKIKEFNEGTGFIFISSHKEVRDALREEGIHTEVLYPSLKMKEEYIKRYEERGSSESFIKLLKNNYDSWIKELKEEHKNNKPHESTLRYFKLEDETVLDFIKKYTIN